MDPISDAVKSNVKKTDLLVIIDKDDKITFYGNCKTVITEDSLLFRSVNDLKYTDANLAKSFVCHKKIVCIKDNEIDTNKYAIILSDEDRSTNIDRLINEVNGCAQTDATKLDNDYYFQAKFLKQIAEECERDTTLADKVKDILLEVLVFYQNNKLKETVDGSDEKNVETQSNEADSDNEESDSEIVFDYCDSSDEEIDKLINSQHPSNSGDTKEDDKNFSTRSFNNEDKEDDTEITFEYIDSSDEEETVNNNSTASRVLSDTFLDEDYERNKKTIPKTKTNEKEAVFGGVVEKVVPTNDGNEEMDLTDAFEYTGSSEEEEESISDNTTANLCPSNDFYECDAIPRKRSLRQTAIKTNGFYAENVENLSPPSKKRKCPSFSNIADNENFVSQKISKFSSKSRNESKIIKAPNYKLVTGNYGGRDVQHLYVFDSKDKTLCYKYTWKNRYQKFFCNSCNWENMSHVWAKLIEDENGEKCVALGPKPHSCKLSKFGDKRRTKKVKSNNENFQKVYKTVFSGFKIIKRKYGSRNVKYLVIFDENDKSLCHKLTWNPSKQRFICNTCVHMYHCSVYGEILKNKYGQKYVRTGPQPHKCQLQNFVPQDCDL